jgi:adenine-specific DNA-methyltransferase
MAQVIWDGKFDSNGTPIPPMKVALPFQDVETVNESAQDRELSLLGLGSGPLNRNRLIWGDKKYVLPALLPEFAGRVNLIYIDPPFDTGDDFSFHIRVGHDEFMKQPSILEQKAYRDTWGVSNADRQRGVTSLDKYLKWFYETVSLLLELLAEDGSLYVHLDYHVGHYAKAVLDELLPNGFKNEIVWKRSLPHNDPKKYGNIHDTIFFYVKDPNKYTFNQQYTEQSEAYKASHYTSKDSDGRVYRLQSLSASGPGPARRFGERTISPPPGTHWRFSQDRIDQLLDEGLIVFTGPGQPNYKRYLDSSRGSALQTIWTDVHPLNPQANERLNYPTQKPEALLRRIIEVSSNPGDTVLDCFCGAGTLAAVAEKLGRQWIAADLSRFAVHTTRKRLLSVPGVRPFTVQNLGKYERQLWQQHEFGEDAGIKVQKYRDFILSLYRAKELRGYSWLHGLRSNRLVHVGSVDSPLTPNDVSQIAIEFKKLVGSGRDAPTFSSIDCLAWDFAFELNEVARQYAANAKLDIRFLRIPREILDKRAVEQGDITFYELASLHLREHVKRKTITVRIEDFLIPTDEVPADVQASIKHWDQWIDYWAVDWDNKTDTFHNQWQAYRTKAEPALAHEASFTYAEAGSYRVMIKVIDILGNDTTKALHVTVK